MNDLPNIMKRILLILATLVSVGSAGAEPPSTGGFKSGSGGGGFIETDDCHHIQKFAERQKRPRSNPLTGYARVAGTSTSVGLMTAGLIDQGNGIVPWRDLLLIDSVVNLPFTGVVEHLNYIGTDCGIPHDVFWYWIIDSEIYLGYGVDSHSHLLYFHKATLQEGFDEDLFVSDIARQSPATILIKAKEPALLLEIKGPRDDAFKLNELLKDYPHLADHDRTGLVRTILIDYLFDKSMQIRFPSMYPKYAVDDIPGTEDGDGR